jgi:peptidoglycan/xylan/chitin deacetylase (PgdA/CDA1 family)
MTFEPKPDPMVARDLVGYGEFPPDPAWPGGAHIAVNFNLNIEGGGEASLANGDPVSEGMLNDIGVPTVSGRRVPLVESVFEYGSRRGAWRLLDVFAEYSVTVSVLGVVSAMEQNPDLAKACVSRGHEMVSHGYRWIDYGAVPEEVERRLLCEEGGFLYDRDALNDELPYWLRMGTGCHLVIPYSYETNDNRFNENSGFSTGEDFFTYMRDAFDVLYREGVRGSPKLLSIGLHDRLIGRPGRIGGLIRLLEYMRRQEGVWFCRGIDIARHWRTHFPPPA